MISGTSINEIWLVRESALGDVVLCEPVLAQLATRHPQAHLTLVTRASYHPLFRGLPYTLATPEAARHQPPPDLCIDLQNRLRTRLLAQRAPSHRHWRKRRGLDLLRTWGGRPLHRGYRSGPHQLERLAQALDLPPLRPPQLPLLAEAHQAAARLATGPYVVVVPGAAHEEKRWPIEYFHTLGRHLADQGLAVVAVGGPGEGPLLEAATRHIGTAVPVDVPLDTVAAVLAGAQVVVGGDTGLLHVAAAVGAPVVVLFGPTPPGRWGPPPGRGLVVARDLPCAPCSDHGRRPCPLGTRACLQTISVQVVADAVETIRRSARTFRPY